MIERGPLPVNQIFVHDGYPTALHRDLLPCAALRSHRIVPPGGRHRNRLLSRTFLYASGVASWRFVGRAGELSRIRSAAAGTTGRGLIIGGPAGVGKSRLLREGVDSLGDGHARWRLSANTATAGLPLGAFANLLPVDQPAGLSPTGLLRWALDALKAQVDGRPVVLSVDDIHQVDPLSAALVCLVARFEVATLLATARTGEPLHDSIEALWKDDLVERVELEPLSRGETSELLRHVLGGAVDEAATERLHRLSQGNALLLRELVLAAHACGGFTQEYGLWRWTARPELGPTLVDAIDARIGELTDAVRTVVELVALGEPLGLRHVVAATDAYAVETAEERQLIRVEAQGRRSLVWLAHPLYGEVVRRRCPVTRARRHFARLAELVEQSGAARRDDLLRVGTWRLESRTANDPALLLAAARRAYASYDLPLAERLAVASREAGNGFDATTFRNGFDATKFRNGFDATEGGNEFDASELLATIFMFADRPAEALTVLEDVRDRLTTDSRRARWHTARCLVSNWGLAEPDALGELAAAAGTVEDPAHRTLIIAYEAIMRLHRLDVAAAQRLAGTVLDCPASSPSSRVLAQTTLAHIDALRGNTPRAVQAIAAVEADSERWRPETPHFQLALELARGTNIIVSGDLAGVDALADAEFIGQFNAGDFNLGSGYLSVVLGQAARLRGRLDESMRHQRRACAVLSAGRIFAGLAHAERAHTAALAGDPDEATTAMAEADRYQAFTMAVLYPWLEHARCWVRASTGDISGAVDLARALAVRLREDGFHAHEVLALHDLVRLGRADLAADRLADLATLGPAPLTTAIAAHARAAADRDGIALLAAAADLEALGLTLYAAEAAADAVRGLRQARSPRVGDAATLLAGLLGRCDNARTHALMLDRPTLTAREGEIARLAAEGLTSKDIAQHLCLSARTIDNHLHRIYVKLGVSGRGDLTAALGTLDEHG
jgi:DNA-binding CsgD family transcriptional regulator